ncbi:FtsK/SpoIIIE domain-containing protein, partial [Bacillus cereus]
YSGNTELWVKPATRVQIGADASGPVYIDLADGPHALVAGTTGAGKSEALTTWLLGLALAMPPWQVNFILVDYKGGAAFAPL